MTRTNTAAAGSLIQLATLAAVIVLLGLPSLTAGQGEPIPPHIKPCISEPPCPHYGTDSWFYCADNKGCKRMGPFSKAQCSSQCTYSPASATAKVVNTYEFGNFVMIGGTIERAKPFFTVQGATVTQICVESCEGVRAFLKIDSGSYSRSVSLALYEDVDGTQAQLPVINASLSAVPGVLPAFCIKGDFSAEGSFSVCNSFMVYPLTGCTRQCSNPPDLKYGDRLVLDLSLGSAEVAEYASATFVVSVYST